MTEQTPPDPIEDDDDLDEPDLDVEDDEEPEEPPAAAAPRRRSIERLTAAEQRAEAAERKARELEEKVNGMAAQFTTTRSAADEALEQERIRAMSPDERIEHYYRKTREENERNMNLLRFQNADALDKAQFDAARLKDPLADQVADEVERVLASERQRGANWPREVIASKLIGDKLRNGSLKTSPTRRKKAEESVKANTVKSQRSAGGAPSPQTAERGKRGGMSQADVVHWLKSNYPGQRRA